MKALYKLFFVAIALFFVSCQVPTQPKKDIPLDPDVVQVTGIMRLLPFDNGYWIIVEGDDKMYYDVSCEELPEELKHEGKKASFKLKFDENIVCPANHRWGRIAKIVQYKIQNE